MKGTWSRVERVKKRKQMKGRTKGLLRKERQSEVCTKHVVLAIARPENRPPKRPSQKVKRKVGASRSHCV